MDGKGTIIISLASGSCAGLVTDLSLFPLDTVKTRLQAENGFWKSGGFRGIYKGLGAFMLGSIPTSASFFCGYEVTKYLLCDRIQNQTAVYMTGSLVGELISLSLRVPFELVKQRAQANKQFNSRTAFLYTIRTEGIRGLYQGFSNNLMRDGPFIICQMPLWEMFKKLLHDYKYQQSREFLLQSEVSIRVEDELSGFESGCCGALAAAISGFLTTPLDVAKTRAMLAERGSVVRGLNPFQIVLHIGYNEGLTGLFAGVTPRVAMLSVGGFIYLGTYNKAKKIIRNWYNLS